jgi:hypothetical protein
VRGRSRIVRIYFAPDDPQLLVKGVGGEKMLLVGLGARRAASGVTKRVVPEKGSVFQVRHFGIGAKAINFLGTMPRLFGRMAPTIR